MTKKELKFIDTVWDYYHANARDTLPWRMTTDPYKILVSELMLQQTQVDRVIPKYNAFIKKWPSVVSLSKASLGDVLKMWQGLGYNRRAKYLHLCAKEIVTSHKGKFPKDEDALLALPGIGPYTAGAVMAFAFNQAIPVIETNIRTVFIFHFFRNAEVITEDQVLDKVTRTLPNDNPKEWYAALMDYGTHLKKEYGKLNTKSASYKKQSKFIGSSREVRGAIIRVLTKADGMSAMKLSKILYTFEKLLVEEQLGKLIKDEMVLLRKGKLYLP